jgi:hypothetical protein
MMMRIIIATLFGLATIIMFDTISMKMLSISTYSVRFLLIVH